MPEIDAFLDFLVKESGEIKIHFLGDSWVVQTTDTKSDEKTTLTQACNDLSQKLGYTGKDLSISEERSVALVVLQGRTTTVVSWSKEKGKVSVRTTTKNSRRSASAGTLEGAFKLLREKLGGQDAF